VGSLGDWLKEYVGKRRSRRRSVPVAERFIQFRSIGAANNSFLENLAHLQERGEVGGMRAVVSAYEGLAGPVGAMVKGLVAMTGGRYESLVQRFEDLDRVLSQEVLKARPIEFGPLVMWPSPGTTLHPEEVGPKAARLSQLLGVDGVQVPPFFVVTVYGYRAFVEASGLQDLINELIWDSDFSRSEAIEVFAHEVREAVLASEVPPLLAAALEEAHGRLTEQLDSPWGVAVRSSAVVEDSESSFAGQFESILNVDRAGLLEAYKQVIASKYRPAAVQYALARGFLDQDVGMPVLVMAMLQPAASGVAYSRDPEGSPAAIVTAVPGLAQPLVEGKVTPDRFTVEARGVPAVVGATRGDGSLVLRCEVGHGLVEVPAGAPWALATRQAVEVARLARSLEQHFGTPQDVEWVLDEQGTLWVVQSRPLAGTGLEGAARDMPEVEGYPVLVRGGQRAAGGVACGKVVHWVSPQGRALLPEDTVLVVPTTSPALAGALPRLAAVVAVAGSPTGHMATVAREFGVPCLVGVTDAFTLLPEGEEVTVDAHGGRVYLGRVRELLDRAPRTMTRAARDPVREVLARLVERVAPLTLTDPDSPDFRPEACRTLHDVARFVHQRAMMEMFAADTLSARERRQLHRLTWSRPMDLRLLDLGGGLTANAGKVASLDQVLSVPLLALLRGMADERLSWSGPVGFDLKGFMSVVVRSAADDQRFGEPSFALCARDYVHLSSRLAYHFATVDSVCGKLVNENYARLLFHGGAAIAQRREWRARFLARVLHHCGFNVSHVSDRVEAVLAKRPAAIIEEALVMLGRLMVAARHLDMVMESAATADAFARSFVSGDYGFEMMRRRPG
jgi:pyruvate,water dikinase